MKAAMGFIERLLEEERLQECLVDHQSLLEKVAFKIHQSVLRSKAQTSSSSSKQASKDDASGNTDTPANKLSTAAAPKLKKFWTDPEVVKQQSNQLIGLFKENQQMIARVKLRMRAVA